MYLLDTNIVVFLFKGHPKVTDNINLVGLERCYISEITVAESKYGAEKSNRIQYHQKIIADFIKDVAIIPIYDVLDDYAVEKVRLEKQGKRIDDFDLLIGATAIANNLIMVTNNITHLDRIQDIKIEDWTK